MSVSRDGLLLSARASEVNFLAVLKRAPTIRCPGSGKKASINQKTCGQTSQKGQRSERLKSQGGSRAQVRRAPLLDSCCVRGLWLCCGGAAALRSCSFMRNPRESRWKSFIATVSHGLTPAP